MTRLRMFFAQILRSWREVTTIVIALVGWFSITWALSDLFRFDVVWKVSIGLLCLSLVGFKFLWQICSQGLYVLSRDEHEKPAMTPRE